MDDDVDDVDDVADVADVVDVDAVDDDVDVDVPILLRLSPMLTLLGRLKEAKEGIPPAELLSLALLFPGVAAFALDPEGAASNASASAFESVAVNSAALVALIALVGFGLLSLLMPNTVLV